MLTVVDYHLLSPQGRYMLSHISYKIDWGTEFQVWSHSWIAAWLILNQSTEVSKRLSPLLVCWIEVTQFNHLQAMSNLSHKIVNVIKKLRKSIGHEKTLYLFDQVLISSPFNSGSVFFPSSIFKSVSFDFFCFRFCLFLSHGDELEPGIFRKFCVKLVAFN